MLIAAFCAALNCTIRVSSARVLFFFNSLYAECDLFQIFPLLAVLCHGYPVSPGHFNESVHLVSCLPIFPLTRPWSPLQHFPVPSFIQSTAYLVSPLPLYFCYPPCYVCNSRPSTNFDVYHLVVEITARVTKRSNKYYLFVIVC